MMTDAFKLKRWEPGDSYIGKDCSDSFVFLGQHRDSDTLSRSNFQCGLERLGGTSDTVRVASFGHWAVGWVELILIHESDTVAIGVAEKMLRELDSYPVLDEEHWSELQYVEAYDWWESATMRERIAACAHEGVSIYAARRGDDLPSEIIDYLA